ncbi:MAG TPA: SMP-30/gluconolactonase/LRE family protein [Microlunatus sp.]|jgi:sugar lactone lactonase YvrE|nr:SMP-30/gluconolactonase/LRE family protein [Microlunatus sp.]
MTTDESDRVLVTGLGFPEALRWHDGALWYADWAAGEIHRLGPDGRPALAARRASFPLCFDLLPTSAGPRPLLVSTADQALLLAGSIDEEPTLYASLAGFGDHPWNEVVLAADGSAYLNNIGFAYDGSVAPNEAGTVGFVVLARPDGRVERVADGLAFPNGMAVIEDGRTLLVAESWGSRLTAYAIAPDGGLTDRRTWAETPGLHPDGIDPSDDGTVWLADVGERCCVRVAAGGEILDRVDLPQPAFDCVVGDLGSGPTLFVAVNDFGGEPSAEPAGRILAVPLRPRRPGR